ncbi:MAG: alpha/beta fold hydrolase, partial [Acidimicrobiia bacterium]|nr:alpha/beta fold hydrolase [Acidimicrobiia bacterium]
MERDSVGGVACLRFEPAVEITADVLLVHGLWGGSWVWDRFAPRLARRGYRGWAIDLAGSAESHRQDDVGTLSLNDHLAEVYAAVDALDHVDRPTIVIG